jgi:hypothetical protein
MGVLAIESYRRDHNEYPESLDSLVPTYLDRLPKDACTGGALVYRREGADYRLYSLGPNGKDEKGIPRTGDDSVIHAPPEPEK